MLRAHSHQLATMLLFALLYYITTLAISTPADLYGTFVIEQRHGMNKTSLGLYVKDFATTFLLTCTIGSFVLVSLVRVIEWGGPYFHVYATLLVLVIALSAMVIYPNFIAPLYNTFEDIKDEGLNKAVRVLCDELSFPLASLKQVDGSKRSAHSNAYFYGFGRAKRIVLYDTLVQQSSVNEIVAVLGLRFANTSDSQAHELGHWKHNHTMKGIAIAAVPLHEV